MTPAPRTLPAGLAAVVIGASAGGIEALSVLLPALPAGSQACVLVVLHLPRDRPSLLAEIFGPKCALPVKEAEDKEPLLPGTVYFAPPDYHLLVEPGPSVALSADAPVHYSRPSVDVLFESAADVFGPRLLGIILTGANQDGSAGLAAVRRAGGYTAVQSPDTAQAALMPQSAIAGHKPDAVAPLVELAALLRTLEVRHAT